MGSCCAALGDARKMFKKLERRPLGRLALLHPRDRRTIQAEIFGHLLLGPAEPNAEVADVRRVAHAAICA